jgi:hypothetical protein
MEAMVNGIPVHYPEHGTGTSVLALHGGGVDHREIMGALEPLFAGRPEFRFLVNQKPEGRVRPQAGRAGTRGHQRAGHLIPSR